jgi:hypothetical protein
MGKAIKKMYKDDKKEQDEMLCLKFNLYLFYA